MGSHLRLRCQRWATQPLASRPEPRCLTIVRRLRSSRIASGEEVALSMCHLVYVDVVLADVLAHLYERRHVLDGVEVLERNPRLGLFGCCHCRVTPSVARLASSPRPARGGRRRGEREWAKSPGVVAMWQVSLARGRATMGFPIRCRCPWRAASRLARLS